MKHGWIKSAIILSMAGLTACAIQHHNDKSVDKDIDRAQSIYNEHRVAVPKSLVATSDAVFISNSHFVITPKQELPSIFQKPLVYSTGLSETFGQTFANIAKLTGVPVVFAYDEQTKTASEKPNTAGVMSYHGTLQQVINQLVDHSGLFWTYKEGKISIFLLETKTYTLDAPIGSFSTTNSISSTSNSSGASSGASVAGTSSMGMTYGVQADSPWTAALTTLKDMLSPAGKLQGNPVEGYVAITDTPDVQAKVANYIQRINEKTNKKIAVRIDVYDVETDASSQYALDMKVFASVFSQQENITTSPSSLFKAGTTGLTQLEFQASSGSSNYAILKALNSFGKTSEVTGATIYTTSGQPAPIQSVRQHSYLASITTTTSSTTESQTSLTPGTVVTGYSMMVTPKIEANNQIMVSLDLQLSTLISMNAFCSNGSTDPSSTSSDSNQSCIYAPDVTSKNFLENMVLHSGQSLLIAGFQDTTGASAATSPTSPDYWLIGGGKQTSKTKVTTVVVVTPYIVGE